MLTTASNFRMSKLDSNVPPIEIKTSTVSNFFVRGLENEKHKKIQSRKDAMLLLDVQEKFSSVNKATREKFQRDKDDPNRGYYRLRDGNN